MQRVLVATLLLTATTLSLAQSGGRPGPGIAKLEKRVAASPGDAAARVALVRAYTRTGNLEGRLDQLRALRKLAPEEPEFLYLLGRAYTELSARYYRRIFTINPNAARYHQTIGENYFLEGRYNRAIPALEAAAKAGPGIPGVHLLLARIYVKQGKRAAALEELGRELTVMPSSAMALALRRQLGSEASPEPRQ